MRKKAGSLAGTRQQEQQDAKAMRDEAYSQASAAQATVARSCFHSLDFDSIAFATGETQYCPKGH